MSEKKNLTKKLYEKFYWTFYLKKLKKELYWSISYFIIWRSIMGNKIIYIKQ